MAFVRAVATQIGENGNIRREFENGSAAMTTANDGEAISAPVVDAGGGAARYQW